MKQFSDYYKTPKTYPKRIEHWFYYKEGQSFGPFDKRPNERNVEKVITNKKEIDKFWEVEQYKENFALDKWKKDLKEEFNLKIEIFNLCYSEAYERGHSAGYDEVANNLIDIVEFANKLIKIFKNQENKQ